MKLTNEVYLVGGGDYSFNLSHRLDCHVYLIDTGDELVMIDTGFGPGTDRILDLMRLDGLDPERVSRIIITHYHADHAGGCAPMVRATGAELWAPAEAAEAIRTGDADQIGLTWAQSFGFYPKEYVWEPCEVATEFTDTDRIPCGDLTLEAVSTPGHCTGHFVLRLQGRDRSYLFASDLVFWGGAIILQNVPDSSVQDYAASMNRALELEFDALLPGHHMISLENGRRHVEAAARDFNRIGLPRDLLR
jgi:glyoxylase-like metal-dependent hydrolase (beta-lactamase superfamily II)